MRGRGIGPLADVQAVHAAAFVKELLAEFTAPTVKQHLAALRMLWRGPFFVAVLAQLEIVDDERRGKRASDLWFKSGAADSYGDDEWLTGPYLAERKEALSKRLCEVRI